MQQHPFEPGIAGHDDGIGVFNSAFQLEQVSACADRSPALGSEKCSTDIHSLHAGNACGPWFFDRKITSRWWLRFFRCSPGLNIRASEVFAAGGSSNI